MDSLEGGGYIGNCIEASAGEEREEKEKEREREKSRGIRFRKSIIDIERSRGT